MKRIFIGAMTSGFILCWTATAFAQESRFELFGGYSYLQSESESIPAGGTLSFAVNLTRIFSIVTDVSAHSQSGSGGSNLYNYRLGPKFKFLTTDRLTPFVQVLVGGTTATIRNFPGTGSVFSTAAGFGLDIGVTRHLAIRAIQIDYDAFINASDVGHGGRAATGVVFRF